MKNSKPLSERIHERAILVPAKVRLPLVLLPFIYSAYCMITESGPYQWLAEATTDSNGVYYTWLPFVIQLTAMLIPVALGIQLAAAILAKKKRKLDTLDE